MKILDLGCGREKVPGAVRVDFNELFKPDMAFDLNKFPYPIESCSFDTIHIRSTLFLLDDPIKVMEEVYRLLKPSGRVIVVQPYFRSSWAYVDPWVKNFATVYSFSFYDPLDPIFVRYGYTTAKFSIENIKFDEELTFNRWSRRFLKFIAELSPRRYEKYLSHLAPLDMITFYLKKIDMT